MCRLIQQVATIALSAVVAATPAFAATWTWNGSQANDHWTNTGNWTPASAVANDGTADVVFAGSTRASLLPKKSSRCSQRIL